MEEKNNIVKYHNDLNTITFFKFGSIDFDFFMALCSKMKDTGQDEMTMDFWELRQLAGYSPKTTDERFVRELKSMNYKQLLSSGEVERGTRIEQFVLFTKFIIDTEKKTITAKVNEDYKYILNELTRNFTRFELEEFVNLDSKYSKTLYRLLKQFRTTGKLKIKLDDFKRVFVVPKSYSNKRIYDKIIKPSMRSIEKHFDNLECKTLYERKPGRPVRGYEFTFTPEQIPKQIRKEGGQEKKNQKPKQNAFHNFDQREYDFDEIERKLLEKQQRTK